MPKRPRAGNRQAIAQEAVTAHGRAPVGSTKRDAQAGATQQPQPRLSRSLLFTLFSGACLLFAVGYVSWAALRQQAIRTNVSAASVPVSPGGPEAMAALRKRPHIVFRSTAIGDTFGKIAIVPLDAPAGPRMVTSLLCDRVYFAASEGVCLAGYQGQAAAYTGYIFGSDFEPRSSFPLIGLPSRARISSDGSLAATTVFVTGHSYNEGGFSTQTTIRSTTNGAVLADLEQFTIWRDGQRIQAPDFNFWGVTFAGDGNRFYATLGTGGKTYLIEGTLDSLQARVLHENVECPSLSPDHTRLAFKQRIVRNGTSIWRIVILDLATMHETPLSTETRSVDDQVEWLDNSHILYALADDGPSPTVGENIWVLPTTGSDPPRIFLPKGFSPTVIR
jgi:hypothetical protein